MVLLFSNYNHFWIEHLWGHHKRVATEEDPAASSALNEPLWTFIWKCFYNSFISACNIEGEFQRRKGRCFWNPRNRNVVPFLVSFAIDFAFYHFFGMPAVCFQLVQSFVTAFLTDNANYIEHYGLRRKRLSNKKDKWGLFSNYERQGWMHAWIRHW
jgi:alkane 1-monooxygenase